MLCSRYTLLNIPVYFMEKDLTSRIDWLWGVNGHNHTYPAYPEEQLEEQIKLAADLGVKIYRLNYTPTNDEMFSYLDKVVDTCERYGLKLFLVTFDWDFINFQNPESLYGIAKAIADRYCRRIYMYQISNEQDIPSLDLAHLKDPVGNDRMHYDMERYNRIKRCMEQIIRAFKEGDPSAKTSVNISWRHTAFLDLLIEDGLRWDVTGLDWYWALENNGHNNIVETIEHIASLPVDEIIIAEANAWEGDYKMSEEEMRDYNIQAMHFYYNYPCEKLKGFIVYELLDEPDKEFGESHFGLALCDIRGHIGRKKLSYIDIASRLKREKQ